LVMVMNLFLGHVMNLAAGGEPEALPHAVPWRAEEHGEDGPVRGPPAEGGRVGRRGGEEPHRGPGRGGQGGLAVRSLTSDRCDAHGVAPLQVIEAPDPDGSASDAESQISTNTSGQNQNPSATEPKDTSDSSGARKAPSGPPGGADHEDTLVSSGPRRGAWNQRVLSTHVVVFRTLTSCPMKRRR